MPVPGLLGSWPEIMDVKERGTENSVTQKSRFIIHPLSYYPGASGGCVYGEHGQSKAFWGCHGQTAKLTPAARASSG